jgi:hypothetical protein
VTARQAGQFDAEKEPVVRIGEIARVGRAVQGDAVPADKLQRLFEIVGLPNEGWRVKLCAL